ncbi:MAG: pantoate--beta-alanine ligase, partial [Gammaproteobacteria bacterium]
MEICPSIAAIRQQVATWKQQGLRVAFVPTMGNLHQGHLDLVAAARQQADRVVASIYVNPLQFNEASDFAAYPRTLEQDQTKLQTAGCHALFVPQTTEIYPQGQDTITKVTVPGLSDILEGACRPGHFTGVATVVTKLFNIVQPDIALFGEKDFQQLMLIRRMVTDLAMPIDIVPVPTRREADGLAMSSRNNRLTAEQRLQAPAIYRTLLTVYQAIRDGNRAFEQLEQSAVKTLQDAGFDVEYILIRRADDLQAPDAANRQLVLLAAARVGDIRLIDNLLLDVS